MLVRYETKLVAKCPRDENVTDVYHVVIEVSGAYPAIACEDINAEINKRSGVLSYQEEHTLALARKLNATVTTTGYHSGVKVICRADSA